MTVREASEVREETVETAVITGEAREETVREASGAREETVETAVITGEARAETVRGASEVREETAETAGEARAEITAVLWISRQLPW